ncbi:MAG: protein-export chaperone SecB [Gammaproteobacteria bacterium]|nr:protein-export chaperone SecB [Gammaproteobacteria bacterium]MDH5628657.1 protein-export chaperone SecB [Gammaproteobacteria bacterium]
MSEQENNTTGAAAETAGQPANFGLQKLYLKDVSFEAPNSPEIFSQEYKPQVKVEMNSKARPVADKIFEVVLNITLSSELEGKTAFLVEVQQAGLFLLDGFNEQQANQILSTAAPEILYPYAREVIASLTGNGGFPAVHLAPVNFTALFMEKMQQAQAAQAAQDSGSETVQ